MERLRDSASVKTVYGDPIAAQGRTIIPVARIVYGFGGGAGKHLNGGGEPKGEGEGGGGGMVAIPVGVCEITDTHTSFVPLHDNRKLMAAGLAGLCLGMLWARRARKRREPGS